VEGSALIHVGAIRAWLQQGVLPPLCAALDCAVFEQPRSCAHYLANHLAGNSHSAAEQVLAAVASPGPPELLPPGQAEKTLIDGGGSLPAMRAQGLVPRAAEEAAAAEGEGGRRLHLRDTLCYGYLEEQTSLLTEALTQLHRQRRRGRGRGLSDDNSGGDGMAGREQELRALSQLLLAGPH
jgi:hypothetical protein